MVSGVWGGSPSEVLNGYSAYSGGGMVNSSSSLPTVTDCIRWGNTAPTGPEIYNASSSPVVSYSCVGQTGYGGSNGNIESDPLFIGSVLSGGVPATADSVSAYDTATGRTVLTHTGAFTADTLIGMTLWLDTDNDATVDTAYFIIANDADTVTVLGDADSTAGLLYDVRDYRLQATSPCIDTGTDTSGAEYGSVIDDIDGILRPQGTAYDMGAYEY